MPSAMQTTAEMDNADSRSIDAKEGWLSTPRGGVVPDRPAGPRTWKDKPRAWKKPAPLPVEKGMWERPRRGIRC